MTSTKNKIIMIGLEEVLEIYDSGHRSRMISKAFSESEEVDEILIIFSPVSFISRLLREKTENLSTQFNIIKKGLLSTTYRVNNKISLVSITSLIPESNNIFCKIERMIIAHRIKRIIKKSKIKYNMLWISNPLIIDIASRIHLKTTVFDAIDNLLVHPQMRRWNKKIKEAYAWVTKKADIIFIGSENQRNLFNNKSNIKLLTNGVDEIFFKNPCSTIPADFMNITHPIIGYCGAIQNRLNTNLIYEAARTLPQYSFVFVGPVISKDHISILKGLKNVYFLGTKRFNEIPSYISQFDVAIIPHEVNEFTESMNPLKIYEYLACGKPVVTTPVYGSSQFKNYIYIAENPNEFITCLKTSIDENSDIKSDMRKKAVEKFSWTLIINDCLRELKLNKGLNS